MRVNLNWNRFDIEKTSKQTQKQERKTHKMQQCRPQNAQKTYATARAWTIMCGGKCNDCHLNKKDSFTVLYAPVVLRIIPLLLLHGNSFYLLTIYVLFAFESVEVTKRQNKKDGNRIIALVRQHTCIHDSSL